MNEAIESTQPAEQLSPTVQHELRIRERWASSKEGEVEVSFVDERGNSIGSVAFTPEAAIEHAGALIRAAISLQRKLDASKVEVMRELGHCQIFMELVEHELNRLRR